MIGIGTDIWTSDSNGTPGNRIQKNGAAVTISGTAPAAGILGLGHDPTNSYLLALDSTTTIKRYSGISGTTITFVSTITLDTAVTLSNFFYDNTNSRYICIDTTANVVRRFNASGTTIDTAAYTCADTNIVGVVPIDGRVCLVNILSNDTGTAVFSKIQFIPTTMTI
jgi:hypothetical protein